MKSICLNDVELGLMQELVTDGYGDAALLYVLQFRSRMCFARFSVGDTKESRVAEGWLMACLQAEPRRGSRAKVKKITRHYVQRQIQHLIEVGLLDALEKKHKNDPMRFFLPVAAQGALNRPEEERTINEQRGANNGDACGQFGRSLTVATTDEHDDKAYSFINEQQKKAINELILVKHKDNNIYNHKSAVDNFERPVVGCDSDGRTLQSGWQCDAGVLSYLAARFTLPLGFLEVWSMEFKIYWREAGSAMHNWHERFMDYVERGYLEKNARFISALEQFNKKKG